LEKVMVEGKGFRRRVRPSPAPHAKQRLVGPGARHGGRPRREPTARRHRTRPGSFWEWVRRPGRRTRSHALPPAGAPSADGTPPSRTSAWPPRGSGTRESPETSASRPPRRRTSRRRRGRVRCTSESWPGRPGGTAPSWPDRSPRARRTLHTLAWSSPRRNGTHAAAPATAYRKTRVEYACDRDSASNGRGPFGGDATVWLAAELSVLGKCGRFPEPRHAERRATSGVEMGSSQRRSTSRSHQSAGTATGAPSPTPQETLGLAWFALAG